MGIVPGMREGPLAALACEGRSNAHYVRLGNTKRKFCQVREEGSATPGLIYGNLPYFPCLIRIRIER